MCCSWTPSWIIRRGLLLSFNSFLFAVALATHNCDFSASLSKHNSELLVNVILSSQDFALFLEPYASEISTVDIVVDHGSMIVRVRQESNAAASPTSTSSAASESAEEHGDHDKLLANSTIRSSKIAIVEFINEVTIFLYQPFRLWHFLLEWRLWSMSQLLDEGSDRTHNGPLSSFTWIIMLSVFLWLFC